jgi:dolichyl-phosphate-mannose-protein mannosyltransferase
VKVSLHSIRNLSKNPDLVAYIILGLLVLSFTLPFLNHAFHIDEPLFLRIAREIQGRPFDPYGFKYLWNDEYKFMHKIAAYPPLFPYILALAGWGRIYPSEWSIHLALIPFAMLGILSFYALARQWDLPPKLAFLGGVILATSPAYLVAANLAMPDMEAVSLMLFSTALSIRGFVRNHNGFLVAGGIILGLSLLCRYNTLPAPFFLFLLGLTYSKPRKAWIPSVIALSIFLLWMIYSRVSWGEAHVFETVSHFGKIEGFMERFWVMNNHLTLSSFIPLYILLSFRIRDFHRALWAALGALTLLAAFIFFRVHPLRASLWPELLFVGLGSFSFFYLGITSFSFLAPKNSNRFSGQTLREAILFGWSFAILSIPLIYIFFASKYLLLATPWLILILIAQFKENGGTFVKIVYSAACLMGVISIFVAASDFSLAECYRKISHDALPQHADNQRVWFTGHWGWQYYLEKYGASPLPTSEYEALHTGDLVLTAENVAKQQIHPQLASRLRIFESFSYFSRNPFRTMNGAANAGFYSNAWGTLPYSLSHKPLETFRFYIVQNSMLSVGHN